MNKITALNYLIASAICVTSNGELTCEDCPLFEAETSGCASPTEEQLVEAVKAVKEAADEH